MASLVVPGVAFMIASSPQTFKLMRSVLGNWVSSAEGVATFPGLFLHMLFFLFVLYLVGRYLPKVSFMEASPVLCSTTTCKPPLKCNLQPKNGSYCY